MLLGTNKNGTTAWHYAAKWGNSEILQNVWEWAKENLTKEEINDKLLLGTDKDGGPPGTTQQRGAIQRYLEKYGSGLKRI